MFAGFEGHLHDRLDIRGQFCPGVFVDDHGRDEMDVPEIGEDTVFGDIRETEPFIVFQMAEFRHVDGAGLEAREHLLQRERNTGHAVLRQQARIRCPHLPPFHFGDALEGLVGHQNLGAPDLDGKQLQIHLVKRLLHQIPAAELINPDPLVMRIESQAHVGQRHEGVLHTFGIDRPTGMHFEYAVAAGLKTLQAGCEGAVRADLDLQPPACSLHDVFRRLRILGEIGVGIAVNDLHSPCPLGRRRPCGRHKAQRCYQNQQNQTVLFHGTLSFQ